MLEGKTVLLGVTGSIAAYKIAYLASALKKQHADVHVLMTRNATNFINPITDGVVLPILNLNGYKIANPTIFGRMSHQELVDFFHGCGWEPYFVEGDDPMTMHRLMADTMDTVIARIKEIHNHARQQNDATRPVWPMVILRTPKGWTGPKVVDGKRIEGNFLAHQVPIAMDKPEHLQLLSDWLHSYHAEELSLPDGSHRLRQGVGSAREE